MTEEAGFLTVLKENPNDNVTRLVYADWLEDHHQPQKAEFIRLLIAFQGASGERRNELGLQIAWHAQRDEIGHIYYSNAGKPCHLLSWELTAERFLESNTSDLIALYGPFFDFVVTAVRPGIHEFANSANLRFVNSLDLSSSELGDEGIIALARSPYLGSIKRLGLYDNDIGVDGITALAQCERLSGLTDIDLALNRIDEHGAQALATSPYLSSINWLCLDYNDIGDEGVQELAASPGLSSLTILRLRQTGMATAGAVALANTAQLTSLASLDLSRNGIDDAGAGALADSTALSSLRHLELSTNNIDTDGALALANSAFLNRLNSLGLWGNAMGDIRERLNEIEQRIQSGGREMQIVTKHDIGKMQSQYTKRKGRDKWSRLIREAEPQDRLTAGIS